MCCCLKFFFMTPSVFKLNIYIYFIINVIFQMDKQFRFETYLPVREAMVTKVSKIMFSKFRLDYF